MREIKCDRCGKALRPMQAKTLSRKHQYGTMEYDLCDECYQEFKHQFLKEYARKQEEQDD